MEKIIKFGEIDIQKQKFHQHKGLISVKNIDINKKVVCNEVSLGKKGFKYFIDYKDAKKVGEPVYNEKYLKAKTKSYNGKINTNFHNNNIQKEGSQYICLSVILLDSVFRTGKNYYPQGF